MSQLLKYTDLPTRGEYLEQCSTSAKVAAKGGRTTLKIPEKQE